MIFYLFCRLLYPEEVGSIIIGYLKEAAEKHVEGKLSQVSCFHEFISAKLISKITIFYETLGGPNIPSYSISLSKNGSLTPNISKFSIFKNFFENSLQITNKAAFSSKVKYKIQAVISVPAEFTEEQRNFTAKAAELAGFNEFSLFC